MLPPGLFEELVDFSRGNGQLINTVNRLHLLYNNSWQEGKGISVEDYTVNPATNGENVVTVGHTQIKLYQVIRDHAQDMSNENKWLLGAITIHLLPALYALLGSFLHDLRSFAHRVPDKYPSMRSTRFLMAAIAGVAISPFSSLLQQNIPFPPLAFAFLLGYSIEAFTSQLDSLVHKLTKKSN